MCERAIDATVFGGLELRCVLRQLHRISQCQTPVLNLTVQRQAPPSSIDLVLVSPGQVPGEMDFIQELESPLEEDDDGFLKPAPPPRPAAAAATADEPPGRDQAPSERNQGPPEMGLVQPEQNQDIQERNEAMAVDAAKDSDFEPEVMEATAVSEPERPSGAKNVASRDNDDAPSVSSQEEHGDLKRKSSDSDDISNDNRADDSDDGGEAGSGRKAPEVDLGVASNGAHNGLSLAKCSKTEKNGSASAMPPGGDNENCNGRMSVESLDNGHHHHKLDHQGEGVSERNGVPEEKGSDSDEENDNCYDSAPEDPLPSLSDARPGPSNGNEAGGSPGPAAARRGCDDDSDDDDDDDEDDLLEPLPPRRLPFCLSLGGLGGGLRGPGGAPPIPPRKRFPEALMEEEGEAEGQGQGEEDGREEEPDVDPNAPSYRSLMRESVEQLPIPSALKGFLLFYRT